MFENVATLLQPIITQNAYGQEIESFLERTVFVKPRSVYSNEFYQAAQLGMKPSVVLILANFMDYEDERLIDYDGRRYNVIRAYQSPESDSIELTLELRTGNDTEEESS